MTQSESTKAIVTDINDLYSSAELWELCERIISSGVLGRSKHYSALLKYLVKCSIEDRIPKEIELAIDVLGRDETFDVSADSTVRVYVHQLRKKLDQYYALHEQDASHRIVIPRGQYTIAAEQIVVPVSDVNLVQPRRGFNLTQGLLVAVAILLVANLVYLTRPANESDPDTSAIAAAHPIWNKVISDDKPILLVMGDYYIFGELNANGNIARMVREFNVNSRSDLEDLQFSDIEHAENYLDLDLSYMPEGSAYALTKIVPVLQNADKPVNITMMSDLTTTDIRNNHIVYIGYISALEKLTDMAFAGSELKVGRSFDELWHASSERYYTSDAGLPDEGEPFRDHGWFSTFPASSETQVILISGMRDAGLMHTAQALSEKQGLDDLVVSIASDTDEAVAGFEALYEVYGVNRMNFNASLIYSSLLNTDIIWQRSASL